MTDRDGWKVKEGPRLSYPLTTMGALAPAHPYKNLGHFLTFIGTAHQDSVATLEGGT